MKYLLWIAFFVLVLLIVRKAQRARARRQPPPRAPETMVGCAWCGVNQPRSESILVAGHYYCSLAHERAAHDAHD